MAVTVDRPRDRQHYRLTHTWELAKNPNGYCGIGGTGVSRPIGTGVEA